MIPPSADARNPVPLPDWQFFRKLLPLQLLDDLDPKAPQAAYTPWVVTWLLVYQRLHGNASLADAVSEFTLRFAPQALPDCPRAQNHALSANTGAYSAARTKLHPRVVYWAADHVFDSLVDTYPPSWQGRRAFLLDGSTIQLTSTPGLRVAFPPARNQHGCSHWPILHLAVAHELASGLAVLPAFGPMYGPQAVSEIALARQLLARLPHGSILLADRSFGIFAFAHAALAASHDVLLRLTAQRFGALQRQARRVSAETWEVAWRPSRWDCVAQPDLPPQAVVRGWLHQVRLSEQLTLWLFTTLAGSALELADLYRQRLDVETDIRNLKETLALDQLSGKSVDMVEKELAAGLLAYNLANQVRRLAASRGAVAPRRLSFAGVWSLLRVFVAGLWEVQTEAQAEATFERLLRAAGQRQLPRRAKGRAYPREVIPRRRKFPERKRPKQSGTQ